MTPDADAAFRDRLALDRTFLAKERTILAYVRTGLAFIGVALFVHKFVDLPDMQKNVATVVFIVPGAYAVLYGMYKTLVRRRERKEFERKYLAVTGRITDPNDL